MIDVARLPLFVTSALVLLVVPGPAVLFAVSRSLAEGRRVGLVSVLGLTSGAALQLVCSILGVTALLQTSAIAFDLLRYAGAAYLILLGVRRLATRPAPVRLDEARRARLGRAYVDGFVVNSLNPKSALFFLAFLPQFVDPARGSVELQMAIFGSIFLSLALVSDGLYAFLAGSLAGPLRRRQVAAGRVARFGVGGVYLGLGVAAALSGARTR